MWRLDTALNWKNSMLFWHKKITYECPDCDPEYVPECEPGKIWDEATQQCIVPPCQPWDKFYECGCKCEEWQICRDWACVTEEAPCWECYKYEDWECVRDTEACPGSQPPTPWPTPVDPPVCWDCYTYNSTTGECEFDPPKCPEPPVCKEWYYYNSDTWECEEKIKEVPPTPVQDDCVKYTNVWDWIIVNSDWKITWAAWNTKLNWRRYWFSTDCVDRIEFYARVTTVWEWANKSWIEHWYAETLWSLTYTVQAYYWDYVQLHHNDVLKIIIYSDWREDTYIKSFIRNWVWTNWELFSIIKKPEVPAWRINWIMCWVLWWAEIWDIKQYEKWEEFIDDPVVEEPPYLSCDENCYQNLTAYWTVRDSAWNVWYTKDFWNDSQWLNWTTKNWCTYEWWILTIPKNTSGYTVFEYEWFRLPISDIYPWFNWMLDMKFKLIWTQEWGIYFRFWKKMDNWSIIYEDSYTIVVNSESELQWKDLRLVTEVYYASYSDRVFSESRLYYWDWNDYEFFELFRNPFNVDEWYSGAEGYMEIELDSHSSADSIVINYAWEWYKRTGR